MRKIGVIETFNIRHKPSTGLLVAPLDNTRAFETRDTQLQERVTVLRTAQLSTKDPLYFQTVYESGTLLLRPYKIAVRGLFYLRIMSTWSAFVYRQSSGLGLLPKPRTSTANNRYEDLTSSER